MKKEIIIIPKDKCPCDIILNIGKRTMDSWIFLHKNALKRFYITCSKVTNYNLNCLDFFWNFKDNSSQTLIRILYDNIGDYFLVTSIQSSDISFKNFPNNPKEIFFICIEE